MRFSDSLMNLIVILDALLISKTFRYLNSGFDYFFAMELSHLAMESMMSNV